MYLGMFKFDYFMEIEWELGYLYNVLFDDVVYIYGLNYYV